MNTVTSPDGTTIAYDRVGSGPPVILVDGALCYRGAHSSAPLGELLAQRGYTAYTYDRRGRGESGNTPPYAVGREVEDIAALVEAAGGSAVLYGHSSGAALALEAANRGVAARKLVLYEPPFIVDDSRPPATPNIVDTLQDLVAEDRRGDAVRLFLREVGLPGPMVALMRFLPAWKKLTAVAHTLPYDMTIVDGNQTGEPLSADRWPNVTAPTLVVVGGKSPPFFHNGTKQLAGLLPDAEHRVLDGQNHMLKPKAMAPLLAAYLEEGPTHVHDVSERVEGVPGSARSAA